MQDLICEHILLTFLRRCDQHPHLLNCAYLVPHQTNTILYILYYTKVISAYNIPNYNSSVDRVVPLLNEY